MPLKGRLFGFGAVAMLAILAATRGANHITPAAAQAATPAQPRASQAPPPECATKLPIKPLLVPSWAFVVNFEVIQLKQNNTPYPVGCLIVWRAPFNPSDYVSIDTCEVFGAVSFGGGQAVFAGGDVRCRVNVKAALAALSPPVDINAEEPYPPFEIAGLGEIRAPTPPHPYSNPLAYYQPDAADGLPVGLFVSTANRANDVYTLLSHFNGINNLDDSVGFPAGPGQQTWSAKHQAMQGGYRVEHFHNFLLLSTFSPRPLVSLRTDGATVYVGGSPLGPGFDGALDEVIVDPPDKIGPSQNGYSTWGPMTMR